MTAGKFPNQVKFNNQIPQPDVRYPIAQSQTPNVIICIVLCAVSLLIVLIFTTSLLLHRDEKSVPREEETSSTIWQEIITTIEQQSTPSVEETTTKSAQEETTLPIEGKPEQQGNRYHFVTHTASTVAIGSHLWTVSKNQMEVNITSTDENYSSCNLVIKQNFSESISGAAVGNKIVIWSASVEKDIGLFKRIKYTILLLDPVQCTYNAIENMEDRMLPLSRLDFPLTILTHSDSLEIFYPSQTTCFPCRFDSNGNKIKLENQAPSQAGEPILAYHLQTINRPGKSRNYVYAVNYKNRTSVLRLFDQDYKDINQVVLEHKVDSIAAYPDQNTAYIGVYYLQSGDEKSAFYTMFDAELKTIFDVDVSLSDASATNKPSISIDSMGNTYMTVIDNFESKTGRSVAFLYYNGSGVRVWKMNSWILEDEKHYEVQAILLNDNKYCTVIHEVNDNESGMTDIKCTKIY